MSHIAQLLPSRRLTRGSISSVLLTMSQFVEDRDPAAMQAFVDAGVDLDQQDERKNTALIWAIVKGYPEMAKQLITKGAKVDLQNKRKETPLMFAASKNNVEIAKMLLDAGADVNQLDRDANSALSYYTRSPEMKALLTERGAKFNTYLSATDDKAQTEFLESLTPQERDLLASYIAKGVPIINGVLTSNVNPEKFGQEVQLFMKIHTPEPSKMGFVQKYLSDFLRLVNRAPVLKEELHVWRGIKSRDDLPDGKTFLSTSHSDTMARLYTQKTGKCCMLKMTIKPGVRVIYIEPLRDQAYSKMPNSRTPPNLREVLVVPPYDSVIVDEGGDIFTVTLSPKAPYVRKSGTRRRRRRRATYRK